MNARCHRRWATGQTLWIGTVCVLMVGIAPLAIRADVVHLTNGRTMEGIVIGESSDQVRLKLPFGELGLPRSSVLRVEREESDFEQYLERRQALRQRHAAAAEWLDLAVWAATVGLDHSSREAALFAARLEPGLAGLAPLMRGQGYEFDESRGEWLPFDDLMRRRGFVESNGRWLSPDQAREVRLAQEAVRRQRLLQEREDRLTRVMEWMVMAQMVQAEESRRAREAAATYPVGIPLYSGYPIGVWPGYGPRPPLRPGHHHPQWRGQGDRKSHREVRVDRPPGSRVAVAPRANHGGIQKSSSKN